MPWWHRGDRARIREQVRTAAEAHIDDLYRASLLQHSEDQRAADVWWQALTAGQVDVVAGALSAALADNLAPVSVRQLSPNAVSLSITLPSEDVLPARQPQVTPGGKWTTKAWTQTARNEAYADLLGAHLVATIRELWAVAPALTRATVVGVRATSGSWDTLFDVTVTRDGINWTDDQAGTRVLDNSRTGLRRAGRTGAFTPW